MDPLRRLIIPLDVSGADEAMDLVRRLSGRVGMFKVGLELFCSAGPAIVSRIVDSGARVFLDLKFHDIPNTVAHAVSAVAGLGASLIDVHLSGGREMIRAAADALATAAPRGVEPPVLLGITVLTSLDAESLRSIGVQAAPEQQVLTLARLGQEAGVGGVVASPRETAAIKAACGERFVVVTPGVRPAGSATGDQKRVMTPREAVAAGADYLVIGRPVTQAADPSRVLEDIAREIGG